MSSLRGNSASLSSSEKEATDLYSIHRSSIWVHYSGVNVVSLNVSCPEVFAPELIEFIVLVGTAVTYCIGLLKIVWHLQGWVDMTDM